MITFFKKLFKRGDFMTRADKWYYSKVIKTWLWSAFAFVIIAWVGTNLVLCALSTNVKSGGDIIFEAAQDVTLPNGADLSALIKNSRWDNKDKKIKTITFDRYTSNNTYFAGGGQQDLIAGITPKVISVEDKIYLYRLNNGEDVYILSNNNMYAAQDCESMFVFMQALTKVTFNNFYTNNAVSLSHMFQDCPKLTTLFGIDKWNMSSVEYLENTFTGCESLTDLNLSNWKFEKPVVVNYMFYGCKSLSTLTGITNWKIKASYPNAPTGTEYMFYDCESLTNLDLSGWDTSDVTSMENMFCQCYALESIIGLENFQTANVISMKCLFEYCNFNEIDLTNWDTSSATDMSGMFHACRNLIYCWGLGNFQTGNVTNMSEMFYECGYIRFLEDISVWDVSQVTDMSYMFAFVDFFVYEWAQNIGAWKTGNVTNMEGMFYRAAFWGQNRYLDLSGWDTSNVEYMDWMFAGASGIISLDLTNWDTHNVLNMNNMFSGTDTESIYASDMFVTEQVTDSSQMFWSCDELVGGSGTIYDENHVDKEYAQIDGGPDSATPGYFTQK